jgi:hypothetical protein
VIASVEASRREAAARRITAALAEPDGPSQLAALDAAVEAEFVELPPAERLRVAPDLALARKRYRERCDVLQRLQTRVDEQAEAAGSSARREIAIAAVDAYVNVMQRTARLSRRVIAAFSIVDGQLAKLGRDALPEPATSG